MLIWVCRIGHCRGFGVQSPWAYRMVRYVINEHYPYYAYGRLHDEYPQLGIEERKVCELCLRLANTVRPSLVVAYGLKNDILGSYVRAGCCNASYVMAAGHDDLSCVRQPEMTVIAPGEEAAGVFATVSCNITDGSVVILLGIYRDNAMRRLWRSTVANMQDVVTFDLYYCGLIFFDRKRYKQNYIINF